MQIEAEAKQPVRGQVQVSRDTIRAYVERVEDPFAVDPEVAPLSFVLSVRRGFSPDLPLPADSFAMYGGHDLTLHQPMRAGRTYDVEARVLDAFEKQGRSGRMWVVVRRADIREVGGDPVAELIERQIVRRRSNMEKHGREQEARGWHGAGEGASGLPPSWNDARPRRQDVEIGDTLGPVLRAAPGPDRIAGYAGENHTYENLFASQSFARRLGYRDVIVPGPMQTAYLEQFLQDQLPSFVLQHIHVTFRMSLIGGDPMRLRGVVTELDDRSGVLTCDLMIENRDGERATVGQATLRQG